MPHLSYKTVAKRNRSVAVGPHIPHLIPPGMLHRDPYPRPLALVRRTPPREYPDTYRLHADMRTKLELARHRVWPVVAEYRRRHRIGRIHQHNVHRRPCPLVCRPVQLHLHRKINLVHRKRVRTVLNYDRGSGNLQDEISKPVPRRIQALRISTRLAKIYQISIVDEYEMLCVRPRRALCRDKNKHLYGIFLSRDIKTALYIQTAACGVYSSIASSNPFAGMNQRMATTT